MHHLPTKASHYITARNEGRRLPEHDGDVWCDLCGRPAHAEDTNEAAGLVICSTCLEDELTARVSQ